MQFAGPFLLISLTGCGLALGLGDYENGSDGGANASGGESAGAAGSGGVGQGAQGGGGAIGGSGGAGGSSDCWGLEVNAWPSIVAANTSAFNVAMPSDFVLAPDRLSVHFLGGPAAPSPNRQLYRATRPSPDDPFTPASVLTSWAQTHTFSAFDIVSDTELIITVDPGVASDVFGALYSAQTWEQPTIVAAPVSTLGTELLGSFTQDRLRMMVARDSGDPSGYMQFPALQLHEMVRSSPGAAWTENPFTLVPIKSNDWALCPVLADNGLRMFFGSSHEAILADDLPNDALSIYYTERATQLDPWSLPVRISVLDGGPSQVCPLAVSADGCELWINYFTLGSSGGANQPQVARRD